MRIPETGTAVAQAQRAEEQGWDGITFTDSQNLVGDPFVAAALAAAATTTLRFATGVTNAYTRHPAALATVAATVQETSGGRFVLGIGRGDTALFHLGRTPMPVDEFARRTGQVQTYLAGGTVDIDGHPSRLQWLDRATQPTTWPAPAPACWPSPAAPPSGSRSAWVQTPSGWRGRWSSPARPRPTPAATRTRCRSGRSSTSAATPTSTWPGA